ncbi:hypothetical protein GCM10029964_021050 [Kibdelosporangium lantanae]
MTLYRDTGVVLRVQKLGEADRIITLITRRNGKLRAVAKGVRRTSSRFGARLEPFCHVDVQCYTGRTLDVITQVETIDAFAPKLVDDYQRYTAGCAVLETAERLSAEEGEPVLRLYMLVAGALRALSEESGIRRCCSTPSSCARWPSPAGHRPCSNAPGAAGQVPTSRSTCPPAERSARTAGRPDRPPRRGRRSP